LEKQRVFNSQQATDGLRQVLWGLFKKIVVANNCADVANQIFDGYKDLPASSLVLGALFYTLELYADFSGYSDMALGFARLLGFNITKNFNFPFFAQNIAEYWRRWHMSLTSWLTEYVFTPLSIKFRDHGKVGLALAVIINFTLCGIWHGANWTYVLFGFLHGCYFIPLIIRDTMNKKVKRTKGALWPSFTEARKMLATFMLVMFTNIVFRADSITHAADYFKHIFSKSLFAVPAMYSKIPTAVVFAVFMLAMEWIAREDEFALAVTGLKFPKPVRWAFYYCIAMAIFLFAGKEQQFIYFQF
jgi:D-alanyl-lipoteichoic acid acyltransferase DltB (MBOAT superfamily)